MTTRTLKGSSAVQALDHESSRSPHFLQKPNIPNDPTVIHVPFVVHWIEGRNLVHERVDTTTKVQWTEQVTLLDASARLDDVLMIIEQHRCFTIAPLCPVGHGREQPVYFLHKVIAPDLVENIAYIYSEFNRMS